MKEFYNLKAIDDSLVFSKERLKLFEQLKTFECK